MRTITKKQLSDTNRAKSDLLSAFRGSQFESGLKPSVPSRDALPLKAAVPETKRITDDKPDATKESASITAFDADAEYERPNYSDSKTVASTSKNVAYNNVNNASTQLKSNGSTTNSDYNEFYLTGHKSIYNRLSKLGNAWSNATNENARNELHAEANLLRGLARNYISHNEFTVFSADDALNNVLKNNSSIYKASQASGVPPAMIASALYRESLFHDPLDNALAESIIYKVRGDASFGIGQVRTQTAIDAENAFYEAHGMVAPNRTHAEMKARLQKDDLTNILYVGFVLWHCGQKVKVNITQNYNYAQADDVFQMYNPGSKGHGKKVGNYVNAFYNYYKAVGK